jgi:hypothetical protein
VGELVEPHFLFPFIQYLPTTLKYFIARNWPLARRMFRNPKLARENAETIRLLTQREMRELIPEADLYVERAMGLAKSFTAYHGFDSVPTPWNEAT